MSPLWSPPVPPDRLMLAYTTGDDPVWDARLLPWDILGSLAHIEGLRRAELITASDYRALRTGLRSGLRAARDGSLRIRRGDEDVHSAVEGWLTRRLGDAGRRLHTGRSRNDQVAVDLRLWLKDSLLRQHLTAVTLVRGLLTFAARHRRVLWPGYTHQRRAMPSSVALWAAAFAEGVLDTLEELPTLWRRVDRSPLGSAAGYGVPLPISREVVARALGFGGIDQTVTSVQNGRGKLEAAVLFWATQLGHELGKLSSDVVLFSSEEFGYLELPAALATGSSIMPHKHNPDLFELTRARAAALEGDLAAVLHLKGKLGSGYHRDFQLLKEPLMRGADRITAMLEMLAHAVPELGVDRARCAAALDGGALATDEVMRRVERGQPFRAAYRDVAAALKRGEEFERPAPAEIVGRRRATGGVGNLGLPVLRRRLSEVRRWGEGERRRFLRRMQQLAGSRT